MKRPVLGLEMVCGVDGIPLITAQALIGAETSQLLAWRSQLQTLIDFVNRSASLVEPTIAIAGNEGVGAARRDMRRYAKDHQDFAPTAERLSAAMERGLRRSIRT